MYSGVPTAMPGGRKLLRLLRHHARDAEVHDLHVVGAGARFRQHDVVGLEIPMEDAEPVSGAERVGRLRDDVGCRGWD